VSEDWFSNDALFFDQLKKGYAWQHLPAVFFRCSGLAVEIPNLTVRQDVSEASRWTKSDTDLIVDGHVIEIKSRGERFTCAADFPYDEPFVDTVAGYDAKKPPPVAYVFVSQITGAMLAINSQTKTFFRIVAKHDRVRNIDENFYVCQRSALRTMDQLVRYIKQGCT